MSLTVILRRLRCELRGLRESVTWPMFWTGEGRVDGHIWPWPPLWSEPELNPDQDTGLWPGLIEYEVLDCSACGLHRVGPGWRPFYAVGR